MNVDVFAYGNNLPIEDELLQNNSLKQEKIINKQKDIIRDELLNFDLYKDTPFRLSVYKNKYANQPITDELLDDSNFIANSKRTFLSKKDIPDEFFIEKNIDLQKSEKSNLKTNMILQKSKFLFK